ncbi:MAG: bifunctional 5,10-methylenetetrahydrofolate dehydrogenase/5,10-methenyltetrahydrofolate cyclohydrolase [Acidobacteriia bacterium]|nr:bifunctional 5,10-methylenetetrahydrofolate dehydrogenase/5,10-methenyltetrahydrofolate cyclohydrolase [Terriglobia bacterium]
MSAQLFDGAKIAQQIYDELMVEIESLRQAKHPPGLAAVLVGDNPASRIYVNRKVAACARLNVVSRKVELPQSAATRDVLRAVDALNEDDSMDGILVQLPLPPQIDEKEILARVRPDKDVDGLHPLNIGALVMGTHRWAPCTPSGVMEMLRRSGVEVAGRRAVVLGRSRLVGHPLAILLMHANATVTICHSKTRNLPAVSREADLLVAAIGRPLMITEEFVKPGATVIDVGISKVTDGETVRKVFHSVPERMKEFDAKQYVIVGDVNPVSVEKVAGRLSPVPGGVGPLTIAMLIHNTVRAAKMRHGV